MRTLAAPQGQPSAPLETIPVHCPTCDPAGTGPQLGFVVGGPGVLVGLVDLADTRPGDCAMRCARCRFRHGVRVLRLGAPHHPPGLTRG